MSVARLMQQAAAGVSAGGGVVWTDPDLANASYDSVSFSVAGQDDIPTTVFFKDDGLSMFVAGNRTDSAYQYTLTTAWDISTASYASKSFSIASQDGPPNGITFSNDGLSFYFVGAITDSVYQYTLSTAWDISTASYASKSFSVTSQDASPTGMAFSSDGTKFYISGFVSDTLYQYNLATAWDVSTASYSSNSFNIASQDGSPRGLYVAPTGNKLWFMGGDTDTVYELDLSTAFDLSTAAYNSVSFSTASQDSGSIDMFFRSDGSKMYVVGTTNDTIYQYSTAAPAPASWTDPDLANASYDSVSFSVAGQSTVPMGLCFSPDGEIMYVSDYSLGTIFQYTLSTAFDMSTASYASKSFVSGLGANIRDCFISEDGSSFYIADQGASDTVAQFSLSTNFDISSATTPASATFSVAAQEGALCGVFFKPDGTKMYVCGTTQDTVFQYSLSTAYDVSTASYDSLSLNVSTKEANARSIYLSSDGTYLLVGGSSSDSIHGYSLSSAWDVSSASFVASFSMASQETDLNAIWFSSSGSKAFGLGLVTDTVYQYSI